MALVVLLSPSAAFGDALTLNGPFPTSYRDEVLADNPAGYWRLGETSGTVAADETGANPGAYGGNVQLGQPGALSGDSNTAATLDGTTGRIVVPDANSLDATTTGVSVEFWVKRTKNAAYQVLVGKPGNGQSKFENYAVWFNTTNRLQFYFGNGTTFVSGTSAPIDTGWHHVVATYDNATARLYVDAAQVASSSSTVTMTANALPLNFGRSNDGQYFFGGSLDEVAIYRSVLSPARIQAHYNKAFIDATPPVVTLTSPAAGALLTSSTPAFNGVGGTASGDDTSVTVRVYAGTAATGAPVQSRTTSVGAGGAYSVSALPLSDGTYTARAEQTDASGNTGFSAPRTFTIDTTPPVASIDSGPSGTVAAASASFGFSSNEPGSSFQCRIDGAAFAACTSPKPYSGLSEGSHTFSVRATDTAGNQGAAVDRSWTVDTVAPTTTIDTHPSTFTALDSADFTFHANETAGFQCRLDGAAYAPCNSPASYTGLSQSSHTFQVRATDGAGNVGAAASFTWSIDTTAPLITLTDPANGLVTSDATPALRGVAGTASGDSSSVTIRIYAGDTATGSPIQSRTTTAQPDGAYTTDAQPLPAGQYTAKAEQADAVGNVGSSSTNTFTIDFGVPDTDPPVVTLTSPAQNSLTNDATPTLAGIGGRASGDDPTVTVNVYAGSTVNGSPVQSRTAAVNAVDGSYSVDAQTLADGTYTARAEQTDQAANKGFSNTRTFTVDATAPAASIDSGPSGTVSSASASFTFSSNEPGSTLECRLDGAAFATCTSPKPYSGLSEGSHTFSVRATDAAGNTGSVVNRTWTVDTIAPTVTLTSPAPGSKVQMPTAKLGGAAGTAAGDSATVTVRVYQGSDATGTAIQVRTATRQSDGSYTVDSTTLPEGTFTARAEQSDAVGNTGFSAALTFTRADPTMIGAGDISSCEASDGDAATAAIINQYPDATVFTLGDDAYTNGQPSEYANCYDPTWGQFKSRTRPLIGDHDEATVPGGPPAGTGYHDYFADQLAPFGPTANDPTKFYYSYDIGTWHVVVPNSLCYFATPNCDVTQMEQWMQADLDAHPNQCTLALWHSPRWSSGSVHANQTFVQPLWTKAYDNGVDLVLDGDEHVYERFMPMDANGNPDAQFGVREFIVGTGGYFRYDLGTRLPTSEVFDNTAYGVIKLTLHPGSYDWQFIPEAGKTFTDSGTGTCHGAPPQAADTPQVRSSTSASAIQGATSMTINKPAGTQPGDLLLAMAANQGGTTRTLTPPAGWTSVPNTDLSDGTNARIRAWYHVAGATEPPSYTFAIAGGTNYSSAGGIMAITGADTSQPIAAAAGQVNTTNTRNMTAPSITTSRPSTLLVYGGAVNQPALWTPPQLFTERWDLSTSTTYNVATTAATEGFDPAGATGVTTAFLDTAARGPAIQIAINGAGS